MATLTGISSSFKWIEWQHSSGIGGSFEPEYAPWIELYDLYDEDDPLIWWSRATEKYLETGGSAWPEKEYKMIEMEEGPQRGSIAIEGVQEAFDKREAELASSWVRENSSSIDRPTE